MTDSSSNTKRPTREELTATLSRFNIKDVTKPGTGVVIVGGVRPPQEREEKSNEGVKKPEGTKTE